MARIASIIMILLALSILASCKQKDPPFVPVVGPPAVGLPSQMPGMPGYESSPNYRPPDTPRSNPSDPLPITAQVKIKDYDFEPSKTQIKAGDAVTWTNEDSAGHPIVADDGQFQSGPLGSGKTYTYKFEKPGTYPYHCSAHPSMKGIIEVK